MVKASKGALKVVALKNDLQKFYEEGMILAENLSGIFDDLKAQQEKIWMDRKKGVQNVKTAIGSKLFEMPNVVVGILERLRQDPQLRELKEQIRRDLKNGVSRESTIDRCCDHLNLKFQEMSNCELREQLNYINCSLSDLADVPYTLSLPFLPTWTSNDFQLDETFAYSDNDVHSYLLNPGLPLKVIVYGSLGGVIAGPGGGKCKITLDF